MYSLRKTVRVDALKDAERESATYGEIGYGYCIRGFIGGKGDRYGKIRA